VSLFWANQQFLEPISALSVSYLIHLICYSLIPADAYPFCYVAGTTACSRAAASASFPGEAWRNCNPETEGGREAAASVNPCSCTTNQDSGGVEVPGGCGQFLAASSEYYCYVTGSTGCEAATASSNFPGAGWRKCEPSDIPDCQCSADGASNGVYTGRAGKPIKIVYTSPAFGSAGNYW